MNPTCEKCPESHHRYGGEDCKASYWNDCNLQAEVARLKAICEKHSIDPKTGLMLSTYHDVDDFYKEPAAAPNAPNALEPEKVKAISVDDASRADGGGGKAAAGDNYTEAEIEALQRNDPCEGCASRDGHRCNVTNTYRFDKRSIPKLPCPQYSKAGDLSAEAEKP